MDDRLKRLQDALNRDQHAFNRQPRPHLRGSGRTQGKLQNQWLGKSPWLQSVHFEGDYAVGDLVRAELVQAGPNSLSGKVLA
jgi:tRNA-2-methylthio-N6-dimethylallyladenosine synthase